MATRRFCQPTPGLQHRGREKEEARLGLDSPSRATLRSGWSHFPSEAATFSFPYQAAFSDHRVGGEFASPHHHSKGCCWWRRRRRKNSPPSCPGFPMCLLAAVPKGKQERVGGWWQPGLTSLFLGGAVHASRGSPSPNHLHRLPLQPPPPKAQKGVPLHRGAPSPPTHSPTHLLSVPLVDGGQGLRPLVDMAPRGRAREGRPPPRPSCAAAPPSS